MSVRTLTVLLDDLEHLMGDHRTMVPRSLIVEASDDGGCRLAAEAHYERDFLRAYRRREETFALPRWSLTFDPANGRILKVDFRDGRADPQAPYDELLGAFKAIRAYVMQVEDGQSRHFGLWVASSALGIHFVEHELRLRPALTPPFIDTLI